MHSRFMEWLFELMLEVDSGVKKEHSCLRIMG